VAIAIPSGFERHLAHASFEEAIEQVTVALKGEGFGILTPIDVTDTLKTKLDVDFRRYTILGACIADPRSLFTLVKNRDLTPVVEEADTRLRPVASAFA